MPFRSLAAVLAAALLLPALTVSLSAGPARAGDFTDAAGRRVVLPAKINRILPADPNADIGMGMMAGVPGTGHKGPAKPVEIKYEPTVWGRYAKLLLSSTEFVFIN